MTNDDDEYKPFILKIACELDLAKLILNKIDQEQINQVNLPLLLKHIETLIIKKFMTLHPTKTSTAMFIGIKRSTLGHKWNKIIKNIYKI